MGSMSLRSAVVLVCLVALASMMPAQAQPRVMKGIAGTFIQLDAGNLSYTADQWRSEFKAMKSLGINTLIIGEVARQDHAFCRIKSYPLFAKCGTSDPLKAVLDIAKDSRVKVYVGLYQWDWKNRQEPKEFEEFARRCNEVADEVWAEYGKHPAFAGWYVLGWEIGNAPAVDNVGVKTYTTVVGHLRKLSGKLPIIAAPYFTLDITPEDFEQGWKKLLPALGVDIIALQDGVGCDRKITTEDARPYFQAMRRVCHSANVAPWADVEVFDQAAGWKPADTPRVMLQLWTVSPYVEKIVIWEFNHYLSPNRGLYSLAPLIDAICRAWGCQEISTD